MLEPLTKRAANIVTTIKERGNDTEGDASSIPPNHSPIPDGIITETAASYQDSLSERRLIEVLNRVELTCKDGLNAEDKDHPITALVRGIGDNESLEEQIHVDEDALTSIIYAQKFDRIFDHAEHLDHDEDVIGESTLSDVERAAIKDAHNRYTTSIGYPEYAELLHTITVSTDILDAESEPVESAQSQDIDESEELTDSLNQAGRVDSLETDPDPAAEVTQNGETSTSESPPSADEPPAAESGSPTDPPAVAQSEDTSMDDTEASQDTTEHTSPTLSEISAAEGETDSAPTDSSSESVHEQDFTPESEDTNGTGDQQRERSDTEGTAIEKFNSLVDRADIQTISEEATEAEAPDDADSDSTAADTPSENKPPSETGDNPDESSEGLHIDPDDTEPTDDSTTDADSGGSMNGDAEESPPDPESESDPERTDTPTQADDSAEKGATSEMPPETDDKPPETNDKSADKDATINTVDPFSSGSAPASNGSDTASEDAGSTSPTHSGQETPASDDRERPERSEEAGDTAPEPSPPDTDDTEQSRTSPPSEPATGPTEEQTATSSDTTEEDETTGPTGPDIPRIDDEQTESPVDSQRDESREDHSAASDPSPAEATDTITDEATSQSGPTLDLEGDENTPADDGGDVTSDVDDDWMLDVVQNVRPH